jgi:hypothetical protein
MTLDHREMQDSINSTYTQNLIFEEFKGDHPPKSPYLRIRVFINIKFGLPSSGKKTDRE